MCSIWRCFLIVDLASIILSQGSGCYQLIWCCQSLPECFQSHSNAHSISSFAVEPFSCTRQCLKYKYCSICDNPISSMPMDFAAFNPCSWCGTSMSSFCLACYIFSCATDSKFEELEHEISTFSCVKLMITRTSGGDNQICIGCLIL